MNLDFPRFKRSNLEPPKPSDGKLCVEIANDWKVAHVTQVDEVVLTEEFAKGGEGLWKFEKIIFESEKHCMHELEGVCKRCIKIKKACVV